MKKDIIRLLHVCDTSLAFYFQRQSQMVNRMHGEGQWRFYYDRTETPGCEDFLDLHAGSGRDAILEAARGADAVMYHATRNFRRGLTCREGVVMPDEYAAGKPQIVLIHGEPEVHDARRTQELIDAHAGNVRFFVATANQLNIFRGVRLYPIVGQFGPDDPAYAPRAQFDAPGRAVSVLRRNEWKAAEIAQDVYARLGLAAKYGAPTLFERAKHFINLRVRRCKVKNPLPNLAMEIEVGGKAFRFDNRSDWRPLPVVLDAMREADILLENDGADYPGGGTNHTIGIEAMAMGLAVFNAMEKRNSSAFADWLGADALPPLPNWENPEHYRRAHREYMDRLLFDDDFRNDLQRKSRQYFVDWMNPNRTVPRLLDQIRESI